MLCVSLVRVSFGLCFSLTVQIILTSLSVSASILSARGESDYDSDASKTQAMPRGFLEDPNPVKELGGQDPTSEAALPPAMGCRRHRNTSRCSRLATHHRKDHPLAARRCSRMAMHCHRPRPLKTRCSGQ